VIRARSAQGWSPLAVHKHFEHLIDHAEMVVALELLPYVDQIFVQCIKAPREYLGDVHAHDGMCFQEPAAVVDDIKR
jgi:hypothetical protein